MGLPQISDKSVITQAYQIPLEIFSHVYDYYEQRIPDLNLSTIKDNLHRLDRCCIGSALSFVAEERAPDAAALISSFTTHSAPGIGFPINPSDKDTEVTLAPAAYQCP